MVVGIQSVKSSRESNLVEIEIETGGMKAKNPYSGVMSMSPRRK